MARTLAGDVRNAKQALNDSLVLLIVLVLAVSFAVGYWCGIYREHQDVCSSLPVGIELEVCR